MTDFERLWTSSEDDLERALLGSVLAEAPSATGLRDAALALGLTATTATALLSTLPHAASALAPEASVATVPLAASVAPTAVASGVAATASAARFVASTSETRPRGVVACATATSVRPPTSATVAPHGTNPI
jgi:anti-sigma factor RsiW